jgi:hypothetical protein
MVGLDDLLGPKKDIQRAYEGEREPTTFLFFFQKISVVKFHVISKNVYFITFNVLTSRCFCYIYTRNTGHIRTYSLGTD